MNRVTIGNRIWTVSNPLILAGLSFVLCVGSSTALAQQNPDDTPATGEQQQDSQSRAQASLDDQAPQSQPALQSGEVPQNEASSQNQTVPPNQAVAPPTLTLPVGTVIRVRVDEWISSEQNFPGDAFSAVLDQPVVVNGWVVARRGQSETGRVSIARKAGHSGGTSQLGLQLTQFTLVDGQQVQLQTEMVQNSAGGPSAGQKAAVMGTTMGVGAAIGAVADGGPGAAIGAGVGAIAGAIGIQTTRGRPTVIAPETVISFRLDEPVIISTEKSQFAFQPVTQDDYNSHSTNARPQRFTAPEGPGYPPPSPYYGYPYGFAYPYPYAYYPVPFGFGFYGGYSYGRFGGFRR